MGTRTKLRRALDKESTLVLIITYQKRMFASFTYHYTVRAIVINDMSDLLRKM